ncbi:unnamed protein product [Ectocarpus fasciculatus]
MRFLRLLPLGASAVYGYGSSVSTADNSAEKFEWDTLAGENQRRTYDGKER